MTTARRSSNGPAWTAQQVVGVLGLVAAVAVAITGLSASRGSQAALAPSASAVASVPLPPVLIAELPTPEPPPSSARTHAVEAGDTTSAIAARYGVTVEALVRANDLDAPDRLELGQVLVIPDTEVESP